MTRPAAASWTHGGGILPFPYPPPALLVMKPFGLLPWRAAFVTWSGAQTGLFAFLAEWMLGSWALLPVLGLPVLRSAFLGQTGLFMTDGAMAAFLLIKTRPILASSVLGLVGAVKPQSVIAAPFALWRRPTVLFAAAAAGSSLCLASLLFAWRLWPQWLELMKLFPRLLPFIPAVAPSSLFPVGGKIVLAVLGLAFAARDKTFVGFVVGSLFATPYIQLHDLAGLSVIGTAYIRDWWASRRNAPMAAIGAFMVICPMPAAALMFYGLAVMVDRSLPPGYAFRPGSGRQAVEP
jgi:hypothetical protein